MASPLAKCSTLLLLTWSVCSASASAAWRGAEEAMSSPSGSREMLRDTLNSRGK